MPVIPPVLVLTALALTFWNGTAATILISPALGAQQVAGSNLISADVSSEQGSTVAEAYLKGGLEIFKFGMTVEQLKEILPHPEKNNTFPWENRVYVDGEK